MNFSFLGLSVMSESFGLKPTPSFSLMTSLSRSRSRTRPPLVGSFGIETVPPFGISDQLLCFFE